MKRLVFIILILLVASSTAFAKWKPTDSYKRQIIKLMVDKDILGVRAKLEPSLRRGMNPDFRPLYLDGSGYGYKNPLMVELLIEFQDEKYAYRLKPIIDMLLNHGANIEAYGMYRGKTPLMIAVGSCNIEMMNFLISRGADIHKNTLVMNTRFSVLRSSMSCLKAADMLVEMGVDLTEGGRCDLWHDLFTRWYNDEYTEGYHQTVFRWFYHQPSVDSMECCMNRETSNSGREWCEKMWTDFEFIPLDELDEEW